MIQASSDPKALDAPETVVVTQTTVACEGNGGAAGHPRVFLSLEGREQIDCPYCDRRFVRARPAHGPSTA